MSCLLKRTFRSFNRSLRERKPSGSELCALFFFFLNFAHFEATERAVYYLRVFDRTQEDPSPAETKNHVHAHQGRRQRRGDAARRTVPSGRCQARNRPGG